ncbi:MAG: hypothetical protein CK547_00305 [Chitinophagaceae bacterium]|nr:MAG: hypothetical protein CK547_00305 [Chitinophagaceae bacterium]
MILYNITSNVAHEVIDEWLSWLNNILIPEIMEVGVFNDFKFFQLLDIDETDGKTYTIQFFCDNEQACREFISEAGPAFIRKSELMWGNSVYNFRSILKSVQ